MRLLLLPRVVLHRLPVFSIRETELRNDPQLVLCFPHELKAPLQLQHNKRPDIHTFTLTPFPLLQMYIFLFYHKSTSPLFISCVYM